MNFIAIRYPVDLNNIETFKEIKFSAPDIKQAVQNFVKTLLKFTIGPSGQVIYVDGFIWCITEVNDERTN